MIYFKNADLSNLPKYTTSYRRNNRHCPLIAAFDIEFTNVQGQYALMYIWQFGVGDLIVYGRTWDDLREWLLDLRAALHLSNDYRLIVYDHYMRTDFGFFRSELEIGRELIARTRRDIIQCIVNDCYEFRDSYAYTEMALDKMGEIVGIPKLRGYNYAKIRHSKTQLSDNELDYCEHDILILIHYFMKESKKYKGIANIPLTATLCVKREISRDIDAANNKYLMAKIKKRQLTDAPEDQTILNRLRIAFFGGFNYCTTIHKSELLQNVCDIDITSSYPAQILLHRYPVDKFKLMPTPSSPQDFENNPIYKNMAMLLTIKFKNLRVINPDIGFLPIYRKNYHDAPPIDRRSMVSKKRKVVPFGVTTITDIDFRLLKKFYTWDALQIISVYGTRYDILPEYIRKTVIRLYDNKRIAKNTMAEIKKRRRPTPAENYAYTSEKIRVNRIYGIFVQDPIKNNYIFDGGIIKRDGITSKNIRYAPVLYQWGVWVAAWARWEILKMFDAQSHDPDGSYNYNVVYADTDGLKIINPNIDIISKYNANINTKVHELCKKMGIDPDRLSGLGEFTIEWMDYFKTLGLKQYAYITPRGEFGYHISGLAQPKQHDNGSITCYFDKFETLAEKIDAFDYDMVCSGDDSGLTKSVYYSDRIETDLIDDDGVTDHVIVNGYVLIQPMDFKIAPTIIDQLDGLDLDRLWTAISKFW